ncbi:MAG: hypothetical protein R3C61_13345 [Bacteroidia bacterium]
MKVMYFFLPFLFLTGCERETPQPPDPLDLLPLATQTGENTLGFLLDGEPWTPNRIFQGQYRKSDSAFLVACENVEFDDEGENAGQGFSIFTHKLAKAGSYKLSVLPSSRGSFTRLSDGCRYITFDNKPGNLSIDRFDTISRVISGSFTFMAISEDNCKDTLSITHGRFDVSF